jgi:hypothetical protein
VRFQGAVGDETGHAAERSPSIRRSQDAIRFQLATVWLTINAVNDLQEQQFRSKKICGRKWLSLGRHSVRIDLAQELLESGVGS